MTGAAREQTAKAVSVGQLPAGVARRHYLVIDPWGEVVACFSASDPNRPERQPEQRGEWNGRAWYWTPWGMDYDPAAAEANASLWLGRVREQRHGDNAFVLFFDEYADGSISDDKRFREADELKTERILRHGPREYEHDHAEDD